MSKGIKRVDLNRARKADKKFDKIEGAHAKADSEETPKPSSIAGSQLAYRCFLFFLIAAFLLLTLLSYWVDLRRHQDRIDTIKMRIKPETKLLELFRPADPALDPVLRLRFAQGIPMDLKPEECTCDLFDEQTRLYNPNLTVSDDCYHCLDWESRANLRVYMRRLDPDSFCYNIKWQSYDALRTPLTDCIELNEDQWFGLGDLYSPLWPLNKLESDWTLLVSNLSIEFNANDSMRMANGNSINSSTRLKLGSLVKFSLISASGVHINGLKTDFQAYIRIRRDPRLSSGKLLCLTVACTDKCTRMWNRLDKLEELRYNNNILEYNICTSTHWHNLVSRQLPDKSRLSSVSMAINKGPESNDPMAISPPKESIKLSPENSIEVESSKVVAGDKLSSPSKNSNSSAPNERDLPEGVGLIERTIFATSPDFFPVLDGQTLRQYVDSIVKMGLKTSSILLIDTRWQNYVGSLNLNTALFPKSKFFFDILHNKGFKILLSIKPYVDTVIGVNNIGQLLGSSRLYTARYKKSDLQVSAPDYGPSSTTASKVADTNVRGNIIRRTSLFKYHNETVFLDRENSEETPYLCSCRESREGHCVLLDVTTARNRAWLIDAIKRSNLLTQEVDGIQLGGAHPNEYYWEEDYKHGLSEMVKTLMKQERIYTVPQWTGDFGYIQLAPRRCDWDGLRSTLNTVLNLGTIGYSLVHPGSVWGDIGEPSTTGVSSNSINDQAIGVVLDPNQLSDRSTEEELYIRWLQVSMFMPVLQFNNMSPIEKYGLQEMLRNLIRIRKLYIVPEFKKHIPPTALVADSIKSINSPQQSNNNQAKLPLIRTIWIRNENGESIVPEQFSVGPDIIVAPILSELQRQRDIYLPSGSWRDELRQTTIRGGKWLRNYPIELNEIAWFTRAKR